MLDRFSLTFRPALFQVEAAAMGFTPQGGFGTRARRPRGRRAKAEAGRAHAAHVRRRWSAPIRVLAGRRSRIVDCAAAPALYRTLRTGMDMSPYPNLDAACATWLIARPAFQAAGSVRVRGRRRWRRLQRMSYIDDLEEYDAELELRLKREYATVFGLFRYCVLTAEATYLCNGSRSSEPTRPPIRSPGW